MREEVLTQPPVDECPFSSHSLMMNIIIWKCRGGQKPSFLPSARDLVTDHDPAIMVIIETRVGGDRAKEIIDRLPFQGAIHTETIGYIGGLWLLWNADRVEVTNLTGMEQEIHASVKVKSSHLYWLFTTVYASPRFRERRLLWNNLKYVSSVHNLPWIIAGDFNELLPSEEKFGGRPVSLH